VSLDDRVLAGLSIYKSLAVTNLESFLKKAYPQCYKIMQSTWEQNILEYYHRYPADSAIYRAAALNFSKFLASFRFRLKYKHYPRWLSELAEYEWAELTLYNQPLVVQAPSNSSNLKINPASKIYRFKYPISKIINFLQLNSAINDVPEFKPEKEMMFVFRSLQNKIRYFELSDGTYFIINQIRNGTTEAALLKNFHKRFKIQDLNNTGSKLRELLDNLRKIGIVI
jgi:hypothetical protein